MHICPKLWRAWSVTQARLLIEKGGNPPLVSLAGIGEYLGIAQKGDCLSCTQLEETGQALVAVMRLKNYLSRGKQYDIPLAYYEENLNDLEEVKDIIQMQIRNGRVDDMASKLLETLRRDMERTKERMKEKAQAEDYRLSQSEVSPGSSLLVS